MIPISVPAALVERLGWVLLHSLWQFTLLALLAFVVMRSLQRCSANARYWSLLLILTGVLIAPVTTFLALPVETPVPEMAALAPDMSVTPSSAIANREGAWSLQPPSSMTQVEASAATPVNANQEVGSGASVTQPPILAWWSAVTRYLQPWLNAIVGAWCAGVLAFTCRPVLSWYTVRKLRTVGVSAASEAIQTLLRRTSHTLGLRRCVRVLQSTLVKVPVVVGYFKPLILIPAGIVCGLPMSQLEAILAHELAHVRRHDYLINVLQTLIETVFFYHPAVWWISHEIRTERENCCDDIAVALVGNRVEYGRALLALEELRGQRMALAVGSNGGSLLARVQRLFASEPIRRQQTLPGGLVVTSLLVTAAIAVCLGLRTPQQAAAEGPNEQAAVTQAGEPSNGLQVQVICIPKADDEQGRKTDADVTGRFAIPEDLTVRATLKNVSDHPIRFVGTRYNDKVNEPFRGKSDTRAFGPLLFKYEFRSSNGQIVKPPQQVRADWHFRLNSAGIETLAPGQSITCELQPLISAYEASYWLPPDEYSLRVQYVGLDEETTALAKKHWPENFSGPLWSGRAVSNAVPVTFAKRQPLELVWGEPQHGLQAAIEFRDTNMHPIPIKPAAPYELALGAHVQSLVHVKNVSGKPISLWTEEGRQGDNLLLTDANGKVLKPQVPFFTGIALMSQWTLQPGQTTVLYTNCGSGLFLNRKNDKETGITAPGKYSAQIEINFGSLHRTNPDGSKSPGPQDFSGILKAGLTSIVVRDALASNDPPSQESKQPAADSSSKKTALRPAELPAALQAQFLQWDKGYRHQPEEKFLELEAVAEALVKKTADRDQQASIYAQVAHIAGQSTITKHVKRVRTFALKALELSRDPLQRAYMHSLSGSTFQIDETMKDVAERRRQAATSLLTGYVELLAYEVPEVAPELPPVGGGDKSEQDPAKREQQRLINEAQVKAWKQAMYMRDLVQQRNILVDQMHWLYYPNPNVQKGKAEGQAELQALATAKVPDAAALAVLLSKVNKPIILNPSENPNLKSAPGSVLDKPIAVDFESTPLDDALRQTCVAAGVALELDRDGLKSQNVPADSPVTIRIRDVSFKNCLKLVMGQFSPSLSYTLIGKTIFVSTPERVENRNRALDASVRVVTEQFTGDWEVVGDKSKIRYHIKGREFSRLKNGASFGLGRLFIHPALSPPTVVFQFQDAGGNAGYFSAGYTFSLDNSLWLTVTDGGVPPTDDPSPEKFVGQRIQLRPASEDDQKQDGSKPQAHEKVQKAPTLEFRFVANSPESKIEPLLPPDYLQRHYRDVTKPTAEPARDRGFAWFPIRGEKTSAVHVPVERSIDNQRLGLLADVSAHALLADDTWRIVKCVVVPGENGGGQQFSLQVTLDEAGGTAFRRLTKAHLNQQLAIVVGGTIMSAPMVRNEIGTDIMITGAFSQEEADELAATISPDSWKRLFDCTIVDAASGKPIAGNNLTVQFRFLIPATKETPEESIDSVVWGPKSGSQIKFLVPPRTLRHKDVDKIVVRWGASHPDFETFSSTADIPLSQILPDDSQKAREPLSQIKLTRKVKKP